MSQPDDNQILGLEEMALPEAFTGMAAHGTSTTANKVYNPDTKQTWTVVQGVMQYSGTLTSLMTAAKEGDRTLKLTFPSNDPAVWGETSESMARFSKTRPTHVAHVIAIEQVHNNMGVPVGITIPTVQSETKTKISCNQSIFQAVFNEGENDAREHTLLKSDRNPDNMTFFVDFPNIDASNIHKDITAVNKQPNMARVPEDHPVGKLYIDDAHKGVVEHVGVSPDDQTIIIPRAYVDEAIAGVLSAMDSNLNQFNVHDFHVEVAPIGPSIDKSWNFKTQLALYSLERQKATITENTADSLTEDVREKCIKQLSSDFYLFAGSQLEQPRTIMFKVKMLVRPISKADTDNVFNTNDVLDAMD